jgi:hypothetical protein
MTLALSLMGFVALFLSMQRHGQDWLGRRPAPLIRSWLRIGGFGLQIMALGNAALESGVAYGLVVWLGMMTLAAAVVVAVNCNRQRLQDWLGGGGR